MVYYISAAEVKTVIQVIKALTNCPHFFQWGRPAAMSSQDPGRRIGGQWKNKLCREVEAAMESSATTDDFKSRFKRICDRFNGSRA